MLCGQVNLVGIHFGLVASLAVECGVSGFDIVRQGALRFGGSVGMLGVVAVLWNVIWGSTVLCSALRFGGLDCGSVKCRTLECEAVGFNEVR